MDGEETGEDVTCDDSWNYADILWNEIQAKAVAAAFDQRIAAAVPNGGVLDWNRPVYPPGFKGKPKANAWCRMLSIT